MAGRCIPQPIRRTGRRGPLPGVVSPKRHSDISRVLVSAVVATRGADSRSTSDLPGAWRALHRDGGPSKSRSKRVGEPPAFRFLVPSNSAQMLRQAGLMIADAVRYMSVHSRKQPNSHGHSGTSQPRKQQPARPGIPSSRAVSAGSGRCWVRTSVGLADGFTDRRSQPIGIPTDLHTHHSRRVKTEFCPPRVRAYRVAQVSALKISCARPRKSSGVPLGPILRRPAPRPDEPRAPPRDRTRHPPAYPGRPACEQRRHRLLRPGRPPAAG